MSCLCSRVEALATVVFSLVTLSLNNIWGNQLCRCQGWHNCKISINITFLRKKHSRCTLHPETKSGHVNLFCIVIRSRKIDIIDDDVKRACNLRGLKRGTHSLKNLHYNIIPAFMGGQSLNSILLSSNGTFITFSSWRMGSPFPIALKYVSLYSMINKDFVNSTCIKDGSTSSTSPKKEIHDHYFGDIELAEPSLRLATF